MDNISHIAQGNNGDVVANIFSNPQKFIKYDGQFLYPPRIENKLQPITIEKLDNGSYIAQPKFNGSATSIAISENIAVAKERHNTFFSIRPDFDFKSLHKGKGFMCLVGEFMNKSKKDENGKPLRGFVIWDITAYDGEILIGSTIEERIKLLENLYPSQGTIKTKGGVDYLIKTNVPNIYRAANFISNFEMIYRDIIDVDAIEGFVMKRKSGRLEIMRTEKNNTSWAVKVRKPTLNYTH